MATRTIKFLLVVISGLFLYSINSFAGSADGELLELLEGVDRPELIEQLRDLLEDGCGSSGCDRIYHAIDPLSTTTSTSTEYPLVESMRKGLEENQLEELKTKLQEAWTGYSDSVKSVNNKSSSLCETSDYSDFVANWNVAILKVHQFRLKIELYQNEIEIRNLATYDLGPTNEAKKKAALAEFKKIREIKLRSLALIAQKSKDTLSDIWNRARALSGFIYTTKAFDRLVDLNEPIRNYNRPEPIRPFLHKNFLNHKFLPKHNFEMERLYRPRGSYMEHMQIDRNWNGLGLNEDGNGAEYETRLGGADGHKKASQEQIAYVLKKFKEWLQRDLDNLEVSIFESLIKPLIPRIRHPHDIMHLYKTLLAEKEYAKVTLALEGEWNKKVCQEKIQPIVQLYNMRISNRIDRLAKNTSIRNPEAQSFMDKIRPEGSEPLMNANRTTNINLTPQFYSLLFQGKTNACVGYALAGNIDSHETAEASSPSYAYLMAKAAEKIIKERFYRNDEGPLQRMLHEQMREHFDNSGISLLPNGSTKDPRADRVLSEFSFTSDRISESHIYSFFNGQFTFDNIQRIARDLTIVDDTGLFPYEAFHVFNQIPIASLEQFPDSPEQDQPPLFDDWVWRIGNFNPAATNTRNVYAGDFVNFFNNRNNSKSLVIQALSVGQPLFASVDTDIRDGLEDWYYMLFSNPSDTGHTINITGYQIAISPWSLEPEDVFIVRDSLNPIRVSQKVPATHLMNWTSHLARITSIHKQVTPPDEEPSKTRGDARPSQVRKEEPSNSGAGEDTPEDPVPSNDTVLPE